VTDEGKLEEMGRRFLNDAKEEVRKLWVTKDEGFYGF